MFCPLLPNFRLGPPFFFPSMLVLRTLDDFFPTCRLHLACTPSSVGYIRCTGQQTDRRLFNGHLILYQGGDQLAKVMVLSLLFLTNLSSGDSICLMAVEQTMKQPCPASKKFVFIIDQISSFCLLRNGTVNNLLPHSYFSSS